ncbi:MAG: hypothetical protein HY321_16380 [Armatimonadetes bacterium]|nr:hypothetical protein [Armatimonadota bacterium]
MPVFDEVGYVRYGPAQGARDLQRSDLGKIVLGVPIARFEQRGTPAKEATAAFQLLSERGFNLGRGKPLNQVMAEAMKRLLADNNLRFEKVLSETQLEFCRLIPDNSIYLDDKVLCVEYTWRKGDFVVPGKRAEVAQYILSKLQHYVRKLGWTDA